MLRVVVIRRASIIKKVIDYAHVECMLYSYGILAFEVMSVVRHVSKASRHICGIHGWMEHRQRAIRRLFIGPTPFGGMFRPLVV